MFLQFCECVWRLEPHTWNVNGQDFSCSAIIQFPTHFPYRQIQQLHLYAKVTTDHKKSPVYFNVTSPRIGSSAQQGDGTLSSALCSADALRPCQKGILLLSCLFAWVFYGKGKSEKKEVQLRNIPNPQKRHCYPLKKIALQFSFALETSILISTVH